MMLRWSGEGGKRPELSLNSKQSRAATHQQHFRCFHSAHYNVPTAVNSRERCPKWVSSGSRVLVHVIAPGVPRSPPIRFPRCCGRLGRCSKSTIQTTVSIHEGQMHLHFIFVIRRRNAAQGVSTSYQPVVTCSLTLLRRHNSLQAAVTKRVSIVLSSSISAHRPCHAAVGPLRLRQAVESLGVYRSSTP